MYNKQKFSSIFRFYISSYFKSPLFYIVAILFSVFVSANFFIAQKFFAGTGTTDLISFFYAVPYICILVIPSLCYKRSESVFYDFIPTSTLNKIFIRFLSIYLLYTIMILMLVPVCLLVNIFGTIDYGQLFTSIICLLFYGIAVIPLCIFIDELFQSGISAFIVSAVILAVLNSAHLFSAYVSFNSFITSIFKLLSFAWHFDSAGKGIFDTRDLLWLLSCGCLFIYITNLIHLKKRGKVYNLKQILRKAGIISIFVLLMMNSQRWYLRLDLSANKTFSFSNYTKTLCSKIENPVKITYYKSSSLAKLYPQIRDVNDFLTSFSAQNRNIQLKIKDPDTDSEAKTTLENYGITSRTFETVKNNSTEITSVYSAIIIEYNGKWETIPYVEGAQTLEYDLDGRLNHLLTNRERVVNIIIGNGMSLDDDYNFIIPWLNYQGFLCYPLDVKSKDFTTQLENTEGPLLIIGDDAVRIEQAIAIEYYILSGKGNAFFCVSPFSDNIQNDWSMTINQNTDLVEMIDNWGVRFMDNIAMDLSCSTITMYSQEDNTNSYNQGNVIKKVLNYPYWINVLPQDNSNLGITLFWPAVLDLSGNAKPYIYSSKYSWNKQIDRKSRDKIIETNPFIIQEENNSDVEKGRQIIAAKIQGQINGYYVDMSYDSANITVIPDQYFLNSLMTGYIGNDYGEDLRNFDFLTTELLKLNNEEDLAQLHSKTSRDKTLYKITDQNLFIIMDFTVLIIIFVLIPVLYLITALVIFIIQKRRLKNVR